MVMVETTKKYICEKYICEICFAKYETRYKAEQCEKRGKRKPKFKVGDTVKVVGDGFRAKRFFGKTGIIEMVYNRLSRQSKKEAHETIYQIRFDGISEHCKVSLSEEILENVGNRGK